MGDLNRKKQLSLGETRVRSALGSFVIPFTDLEPCLQCFYCCTDPIIARAMNNSTLIISVKLTRTERRREI